jgi:hypothetical protein
MIITQTEADDMEYIGRPFVIDCVQRVNEFLTAKDEGKPLPFPESTIGAFLVTYKNYKEAVNRIRALSDKRAAVFDEWDQEIACNLERLKRELEIAKADLDGHERECKRARGETVPEAPPAPPVVADSEVASSADAEGARRRKAILQERKGKAVDDLPSAPVMEKKALHTVLVSERRAKRALAQLTPAPQAETQDAACTSSDGL